MKAIQLNLRNMLAKLRNMPDNTTWSSLSFFGNSALAKATILTPVVAIYVELNASVLQEQFGFTNAIWLYWSLVSIGFGQILYTLACPRIIRKYGDDYERFILEAQASWALIQYNDILRDRLLSIIADRTLEVVPKEIVDAKSGPELDKIYKELGLRVNPRLNEIRLADWQQLRRFLENPDEIAVPLRSIVTYHELATVRPSVLRQEDMLAELGEISGLAKKAQVSNLRVKDEATEDLNISNLSWFYDQKNNRGKPLICLIVFLYGFGSVYFIVRAIDSLAKMILNTYGALIS